MKDNTIPKISIIIPCYNAERYISQCLESILNQSIGLNALEIILVDDASTDNTFQILQTYEQKYPEHILLIPCDINGKQGRARNIGLAYATGEYISFVDSDDWIHHDMYTILYNIAQNSLCDIVQFRYTGKKTYESDSIISNISYTTYDFSGSNRRNMLLDSDILNESCTTKLYNHSLIEQTGVYFAEGVSYEEPLFTYPLKFWVQKVAVLNLPLYYYRYNPQGTTAYYMSNIATITEHIDVQQQTFDFMKQTTFFKEYQNEIELYYMHTFYSEVFYFLKKRGFSMPLPLFRFISQQLETNVPTYLTNPYLNHSSLSEDRKLIELINNLKNVDDETAQKYLNEIMEFLN